MHRSDAGKIVVFTSGTHFMVHIYENSFSGFLEPLQQEWGLSYLKTGSLGVSLFFLFGLMAIPGGWLSDRVSSKRLLLLCLFGAAMTSLAASYTQSFVGFSPLVMLSLLLALLGLFTGFYHPVGLAFIARGVERRGWAMGIHGILGNLGLAIAPLLAAWLSIQLGWREAYFLFTFPALILGLALLATPFGKASHPISRKEIRDRRLFPPLEQPRRIHPLVLLLVIHLFSGIVYRMLIVFLPIYFGEKFSEFSILELRGFVLGGFITTVILIVGTMGQMVGGKLADGKPIERWYTLIVFLVVPMVILMGRTEGGMLLVFSVGFAVLYFCLQPLKNCLIARYSSPSSHGLAYGWAFFLEFGFGALGASLGGWIADRWGLSYIFDLAGIFMIFIGLLGLTISLKATPVVEIIQGESQ